MAEVTNCLFYWISSQQVFDLVVVSWCSWNHYWLGIVFRCTYCSVCVFAIFCTMTSLFCKSELCELWPIQTVQHIVLPCLLNYVFQVSYFHIAKFLFYYHNKLLPPMFVNLFETCSQMHNHGTNSQQLSIALFSYKFKTIHNPLSRPKNLELLASLSFPFIKPS